MVLNNFSFVVLLFAFDLILYQNIILGVYYLKKIIFDLDSVELEVNFEWVKFVNSSIKIYLEFIEGHGSDSSAHF